MPRSVGGLEGLVSVLDQPPHQRPSGTGTKGASGAGDSGSTPGTATAPLSSHSSAHSSGGGTAVVPSGPAPALEPFQLKDVMASQVYMVSGRCWKLFMQVISWHIFTKGCSPPLPPVTFAPLALSCLLVILYTYDTESR